MRNKVNDTAPAKSLQTAWILQMPGLTFSPPSVCFCLLCRFALIKSAIHNISKHDFDFVIVCDLLGRILFVEYRSFSPCAARNGLLNSGIDVLIQSVGTVSRHYRFVRFATRIAALRPFYWRDVVGLFFLEPLPWLPAPAAGTTRDSGLVRNGYRLYILIYSVT